jgi:hypothetical protein
MSNLTIKNIINNPNIIKKYRDFIENMKNNLILNRNVYYLHGILPIDIDTEITIELLNESFQMFTTFLKSKNTVSKTIIPFTSKVTVIELTNIQKMKEDFNTLKEIVENFDSYTNEKTYCCNLSYIRNSENKILPKIDDPNKEALDIWKKNGVEAAVTFMTKGMNEGTMDYATMRSLYG